MAVDDLLGYIFEGQPHRLAQPMAAWLTASRRFAAFVTAYRDKIRKKLRVTQDPESLLDLRLELETAFLLLQERTLSLKYEPEPPGPVRRPDFAVTFTTSLTFMLEVTRLRAEKSGMASAAQGPTQEQPPGTTMSERLADAICGKLGQLSPRRSNVLLVGVEAPGQIPRDLRTTMLAIQQRAERDEVTFLRRHRFRDRGDFFNHYQQLSEVLVRGAALQAEAGLVGWVNAQAKHPLPSRVRTVLWRSHTPTQA
jgi:hypothetical protein